MKKALKIFGLVIGILALLIILAVIIVPLIVDVNSFKPRIAEIVKDKTGRDIVFNGNIELKIFPWLRIKSTDITFSNATGFSPDYMAKIGEISAGVRIMPLLKKRIELSTITLDALEVYYTINEQGVSNVDDILQKLSGGAEPKAEAEPAPITESKPLPIDIDNTTISQLNITNIAVNFDDKKNNMSVTAAPVSVTTGTIGMNMPIDVEINAAMTSKNPGIKSALNLKMVVEGNTEKVSISNAAGKLDFAMPDNKISTSTDLALELVYDLKNSVATLSKLHLNSHVSGDPVPAGEQTAVVDGSLVFDIKNQTLDLKSLVLAAAGANASLSGSGNKLMSDPELNLNLAVKEFSPKDLLKNLKINMETASPSALTKLSAGSAITFKNKVANIPLKVKLDDSNISADIKADLNGKKPAITIVSTIDGINADNYMPPAKPAAAQPQAAAAAAPGKTEITIPEIKMDLTPLPDIFASLKIGKVQAVKMLFENIAVNASLTEGVLNVNPVTIDLYGGKLNADAKVTGTKNTFEAAVGTSLASVNLPSLLKAAAPDMDTANMPKKLNFKMNADFKKNILNVTTLNINADEVAVKGTAVADLTGKPKLVFNIDVNDIDLNKYLPKNDNATKKTEKPAETSAGNPAFDIADIPVNADGNVKVSSLKIDKMLFSDISAHMLVNEGTASISPAKLKAFDGSLVANVTATGGGENLKSDINVEMVNVKAESIVTTFGDPKKKSFISGNLSAKADLKSTGMDKDSILKSLNGKAGYTVKNAVLNGIGYNPNLLSLDTLRSFLLLDDKKSTSINDISGTASVANGTLTLAPVKVVSQYMGLDIHGGLGLLDLGLKFNGDINVDNVNVPMNISGTMHSPKVSIDQAKLTEGLIVQFTKKTVTGTIKAPVEIPKNIIEGTGDAIQKGLDKLIPGKK